MTESPPHRAGAISSREPKAFETTSPTAPDISLASALYGNLIVTDEKRERLEAITGAQLVNPINTKLIPGFDVSSVTAWPPVIWETIDNIPETTRKRAFRHRSMNYADNYETLEWMGDKFVGAALAEILHVQLADKHLAFRNIVCCACQNRATMNAICRSLGMHKQIEIQAHAGGLSDRICEDVFEAMAAAIHLELGYATLLVYLEAIYKPVVDTLRKQLEDSGWEEASLLSHAGRKGCHLPTSMDYMKKLKDLCNERGWTVHYLDRNELQGDNRNEEIWTQHIVVNGTEKATGRARNKRMARNNAAEKLYRRLSSEEGVESSSSAGVATDHPVPEIVVTDVSEAETDRKNCTARTKRPRADENDDPSQARPAKHGRCADRQQY